MGQADFTRSDAVIGFGGGAVTDVAGFVAATWLRGVKLIQLPTSVLGMVDASVGGKTGINTAEGKNLVGSFYAPAAVIAISTCWTALPRNELLAGFAEVAKCGFIGVPEILDIIEADVDRATDPTTPEFRRLVELAIGMKAEVVGGGLHRAGPAARSSTTATPSATPSSTPSATSGGTAPRSSVGMVFAAELGRLAGRLSDEAVDRHRAHPRARSACRSTIRRAAGRRCWRPCSATRRPAAACCASSCSTTSASPTVLRAPEDQLLFAAYQEIGS